MEEAIFRNIKSWDNAEEYTDVLLHDWFSELVSDNPLSEQERKDYLASTGWDSDFLESAYFASERQLAHYLKTKELINDYSIEDLSTKEY
jgi:GH35 family endo-1,4-beta-xylanase